MDYDFTPEDILFIYGTLKKKLLQEEQACVNAKDDGVTITNKDEFLAPYHSVLKKIENVIPKLRDAPWESLI